MRLSLLSVLLLMPLLPSGSMAIEPVIEPHAMIYYQIPLSGNKFIQKQHSFGFRMDRAAFDSSGMIEYQGLMQQPAIFDFKMGHDGVQGIYISGTNYLEQYLVNHANGDEESSTEEDVTMEGEDAGTAEEKKLKPAPKVIQDVGNTVSDVLEAIPLGFLIGGAVGVVILSGAGG